MRNSTSIGSTGLFGIQKRSRNALRRACHAVTQAAHPGLEVLEPRQMLAANPVMHFPLDGDTSELTGNYIGLMTTTESYVTGKVGSKALALDGTTSLLVVDGAGNLNAVSNILGGTGSLAAWIKTTQAGNDNFWRAPSITGIEDSGGNKDIFWGYIDSGGRINLRVGDNGPNEVESKGAVNDGQWHFVVMTRNIVDGSPTKGEIAIYVDGILGGKLITNAAEQDIKVTEFSEFGVLPATDATRTYLNGALDDIKVFTDVLTEADVAALYAPHKPVVAPPAPSGLQTVYVGARAVSLKWNASTDASFYELWKAPASDPTNFTLVAGTGLSYLERGLTPETGYIYKARAVNAAGNSAFSADLPITTTKLAAPGTGNGLLGTYYDEGGNNTPNFSLGGKSVVQIDPNVDFDNVDWGRNSPAPGIDEENFNVRWIGYLQPQYSEPYNFYTNTDDGSFVWIDLNEDGNFTDAEIVLYDAGWHGWGEQHNSLDRFPGGVNLVAGKKYKFKMEMYEGTSDHEAVLRWESYSQEYGVIPKSQFYLPYETTAPSTPSGATVSVVNPSTTKLTWTASTNAYAYVIERSMSGRDGTFRQIAIAGPNPEYVDNTVVPYLSYAYRIRAANLDANGNWVYSSFSPASSLVTMPAPTTNLFAGNGVSARYFNNFNLSAWSGSPALEKKENVIDFNWGDPGNPGTPITDNGFSSLYTGRIVPAQTGWYQFIISTDDHGEWWLEGERIAYVPGWHGGGDNWHEWRYLEAGKSYNFIFAQWEDGGGAEAHAKWASWDTNPQMTTATVISTDQLFADTQITSPKPKLRQASGVDRVTSREVDLTVPYQGVWQVLERATQPDFSDSKEIATFRIGGATTYRDAGLQANTDYYYRWRSVNYDMAATFSEALQVHTLAAEPVPAAATGVHIGRTRPSSWTITWQDNAFNETGYRIERKAGTDGAWQAIATVGEDVTSYGDDTVTGGVEYFYRVIALNDLAGPSAPSGDAGKVALGQTMPDGWAQQDFGNPAKDGTAQTGLVGPGRLELVPNGTDIWDTVDHFNYVYRPVSGDFQITTRLASQPNSDGWAKAGVMAREKLTDNSKHLMVAKTPQGEGIHIQFRDSEGGASGDASTEASRGEKPTAWLRLTRKGNLFISEFATDAEGTQWQKIEERTITMAADIYIGLAATAHTDTFDGIHNPVLFENFFVTAPDPTTSKPATPSNLVATALGSKNVYLSWNDNSIGEGTFKIQRSTSSTFAIVEDLGTVPGSIATAKSFIDRTAAVGATYYYRVLATNPAAPSGSQDSAWSNVATVTVSNPTPFSFNGFTSSAGLIINSDACISGNALTLTANRNDQIGGAYAAATQDIAQFALSFDFLLTNGNGADGFAFVIQAAGPKALTGGGGSLGLTGMTQSVALKFDIYDNIDKTDLILNGQGVDGNEGIDLRPSNINLDGGTAYRVFLTYDGTTLTQKIAEAANPGVILFTHDYTVDIPTTIGADGAWIGFTGATGGLNVRQQIVNFSWGASAQPTPMVLPGTAGDDIAYVKLEGDTVNVYGTLDGTGPVLLSKKLADISEIQATGGDGNDTVIFDLGAFDKPVSVDAGGGSDTLRIIGSTVVTAINHEVLASGNSLTLVAGNHPLGANVAGKVLTINAGASAVATADLSLAGLVVDGTLDLKTFDVTVAGGNADTLAGYVQSGAIKSTSITSITTLGVIPQDGAVKVKYTYYGDVNGDGSVNLSDYFVIDSGYLNKRSGFANGDMNYDGEINLNDYFLIDSAYLNQGTPLATPAAAQSKAVFSKTPIAKKVKAKKAKPAKKAKKV